jgi:hypothetical protein
MHTDIMRQPCSGRHDTGFIMVLKGAVGAAGLFGALCGTILGWTGHAGSLDSWLYVAAGIGAFVGAYITYLSGRKPH